MMFSQLKTSFKHVRRSAQSSEFATQLNQAVQNNKSREEKIPALQHTQIQKSKNDFYNPQLLPTWMLDHCTPHSMTIAQTLKTKFNLSAHENFQIS